MEIQLRTNDGTLLDLPAALDAITTYVILEQERWFEKEIDFLLSWLKSDMTVIDIGANVGAYSLPLARRVRHIYAYEPGSIPRYHLERGRLLNHANNLEIIGAALSDSAREGYLVFGSSSELGRLGEGGSGEPVRITSLDHEDSQKAWSPDFVKIDAEGEEARIIEGGRKFFSRHSPLVMFEVKQAGSVNTEAVNAFIKLGYSLYRLLPGTPLLIPHLPEQQLDRYELNLFAAKTDCARTLASSGYVLNEVGKWRPDDAARQQGVALLAEQDFSNAFEWRFSRQLDPDYRDALAGYGTWRTSRNYSALEFAYTTLFRLWERNPNLSRESTLARFAWETGRRGVAVTILRSFRARLKPAHSVEEPFWPASPRYDRIVPDKSLLNDWFVSSALEQAERLERHSSYYGSDVDLEWLSKLPWSLTEMERRRVLYGLRKGRTVGIGERLCRSANDHINADVWSELKSAMEHLSMTKV